MATEERRRRLVVRTCLPEEVADVHRLLAQGEIVACQAMAWGSNENFLVAVRADSDPPVLAVYKPQAGEAPLWDFPDGTLYRREYAAYLVSRALGWPAVPPTVVREGPFGIGTVQLFIPNDPKDHYYRFRGQYPADLQRIALFDLITNNADRKPGHCLRSPDGRIWAIDHGLTFNVVPKLRTVIWDFCGDPIPSAILADLRRLLDDPTVRGPLEEQLRQWLDPREVTVFFQRVAQTVQRGRFPLLDPHRNVPRGFWG
jgi:hypothetical protein